MRRLACVFSVTAVIVLIIGLVDYVTNYNWTQGDQNPFQGNPNVLLNDGATVLISGGFLALGSVVTWILALRGSGHGARGLPGTAERPPGQHLRREHTDQRQP